jgi:Secretion system C-terminal sorting domain
MKNILILFAICATVTAQAQHLLTDNFTTAGALTANGWTATSGAGTNPLTAVTADGLTYAGYHASAKGGGVAVLSSGEDAKKDFSRADSTGKLYATFMLNVKTAANAGDYLCGFTSGTGTNYNLRVFAKNDSLTNKLAIGIFRSAGTPIVYSAPTYSYNTTYLVTIVYEFIAGTTNDAVGLYVHPATVTTVEPAAAAMTATYNGATGTDGSNINAFFLRQGTAANNVTAVVDGIHVAKTWAATFQASTAVAEFKHDDFKIYPTLAKDVLNLDMTRGLGAADVQIINIAGQVVLTKKLADTDATVSLPIGNLVAGSYIIRLVTSNRELTQRFEKQ